MIVDHSDGLHKSIANCRAHEAKPPHFQILAHALGLSAEGRHLLDIAPLVSDGTVFRESPNIGAETAEGLLDL
jgi:hypothetical protein